MVGASGDLARKKVFPALFALYGQGFLPNEFRVFGFARSAMTHAEFRTKITEQLTCRYVPGERCADRMAEFLDRCYYQAGQYDSKESFLDLYQLMRGIEQGPAVNRLFYLAIPPSIFLDVSHSIGDAGLVNCGQPRPWSRVVIEKPFGRDRESSDVLAHELARVFHEDQIYRMDHYLGKEVIQNLLVLRFANLIFEPVWNRRFVRSVRISWSEQQGVEGRGGYFDAYGIVRDVMQNHLLQILALVAMEPPRRLDANAIRDEKVKVLRGIPPLALNDVVIGQYARATREGRTLPAYVDDETVPKDSRTATYGAACLHVRNERWEGVPFLIRAGKALDTQMTEIRIEFREVSSNMFCAVAKCPEANALVIRVQPHEAIELRVVTKVPGLGLALDVRDLDLRYEAAFSQLIPDAYENLLLDVMQGEKSLFIRNDELAAAWDIFTPILHAIDQQRPPPELYESGSRGPVGADELAQRYDVK